MCFPHVIATVALFIRCASEDDERQAKSSTSTSDSTTKIFSEDALEKILLLADKKRVFNYLQEIIGGKNAWLRLLATDIVLGMPVTYCVGTAGS